MFEVVEVQLGGPPVEIFDLATAAGVETFRIHSTRPFPLLGEYSDGFMHYVILGELGSEWLIGPGFDVRVLTSEGWEVAMT